MVSVLADAEWVHKIFVVLAVPVSLLAFRHTFTSRKQDWGPAMGAVLGLLVLICAVFVHELHDYETPLTVMGALILAASHIWRWRKHQHSKALIK